MERGITCTRVVSIVFVTTHTNKCTHISLICFVFLLMIFAVFNFVHPQVVVFSKTFCPFCRKTKNLFLDKGIDAKVIELDKMDNGDAIQDALLELSGQRTVPNVFIKGNHLGGNDDTQKAAREGKLEEMLS